MMMRSVCLCLLVCKNVCSLCRYLSIYACFLCVCMCVIHDNDMCVIVCKRMCACVLVEVLYVCVSLRHGRCFWFQGSPEETTARPGCRREAWPACTALGQSGVKTRPFSPTLPVMDKRALFRMASEKDSY